MIKRIKLSEREIEYDLQRKKVKNINLRIKADRTITVSASFGVSKRRIEGFLREKEQFIFNALAHYEKMVRLMPMPKQFVDGEALTFFGCEKRLGVVLDRKNYVQYGDKNITLHVKDVEDLELKRKTISKWLRGQIKEKVNLLCEQVYPIFKRMGVEYPEIRFRKMDARWGSCYAKKKILTFNYALVFVPLSLVEYVVYHEFVHFLQPNHSKKYYFELSKVLPDWKERRKLLRSISIIHI